MGQRYKSVDKTSWPSGLRRNVKAVVFIGVGSNPTDVNLFSLQIIYYPLFLTTDHLRPSWMSHTLGVSAAVRSALPHLSKSAQIGTVFAVIFE